MLEWNSVAIPGIFSSRSVFRESLFFVLVFFVLLCHNKKDGVSRVSVVGFIRVECVFVENIHQEITKCWDYFPLQFIQPVRVNI